MSEIATIGVCKTELTQRVPLSLICLLAELMRGKGVSISLTAQSQSARCQVNVFEREEFFKFVASDSFRKADAFTISVQGDLADEICAELKALIAYGHDALPVRAGFNAYDPRTALKNPLCLQFLEVAVTEAESLPRWFFWVREDSAKTNDEETICKTLIWVQPYSLGWDNANAITEGLVRVYTQSPEDWERLVVLLSKFSGDVLVRDVAVQNKYGMHCRPSAVFARVASRFTSMITVEFGGCFANGKDLMEVHVLEAKCGDVLRIAAFGLDAHDAVSALTDLMNRHFDIPDE